MVFPECFLLAFLSVTVLVAGDVDLHLPETRIINGTFIDITEVPWQASFRLDGVHICGGVVIGDLWVLTAAHCISNQPLERLSFKVGSNSRFNKTGTVYRLHQLVIHEKYIKKGFFNDICLLKSASKIVFGHSVAPVKLPHLGAKLPPPGTMLKVSGWGITAMNEEKPEMLKAVDIKLYDANYCRKLTGLKDISKIFCAGLPGKNSCSGDSGGPLVKGDLLVGLVMGHVVKEGCGLRPHVSTNVVAFRDWIQTHSGL